MNSFSIHKILIGDREEFSFRRLLERLFLDDWMMKLLALLITLALWFGVTGMRTPTTERLKNVTLSLRVSNSMEITNSPVQEVDLVVTGDNRKIDQIRREDLTVSINLIAAQPGERMVQLTPDNVNVNLPSGVKLESVQPSKIAIKLEIVERRDIDVRAETEDNLPDGFEVYGVTVNPQKVPARGPASYIRSIDYISTEKIDLEGRQSDFTAPQVPLNATNPKVTIIDESVVNVFFRIGERRIERTFIVPVQNTAEKRTATITLYGTRTLLNSVSSSEIDVRLGKDSTNAEAMSVTLPADLDGKVEIRNRKLSGR